MGYYEAGLRERAELLRRFQAEIRGLDLKDDSAFQFVLREAQGLLELSDQEIADALSVSRPTVNRWIHGKNLPYHAMRKPILSWIGEQLTARIKRIESLGRQYAASAHSSSESPKVAKSIASGELVAR